MAFDNIILGLGAALLRMVCQSAIAAKYFVYVGTYTREKSKGIYAFRFDTSAGDVEPMGLVAEALHPSFIAAHPSGKFLYAVNEHEAGTPKSGLITAYAIDGKTGALTKLNSVASGGVGPNNAAVDATGKTLLYVNYRGGSVAALPIGPDGRLGETPFLIQHTGSGVVLPRQASPLPHQAISGGWEKRAADSDGEDVGHPGTDMCSVRAA